MILLKGSKRRRYSRGEVEREVLWGGSKRERYPRGGGVEWKILPRENKRRRYSRGVVEGLYSYIHNGKTNKGDFYLLIRWKHISCGVWFTWQRYCRLLRAVTLAMSKEFHLLNAWISLSIINIMGTSLPSATTAYLQRFRSFHLPLEHSSSFSRILFSHLPFLIFDPSSSESILPNHVIFSRQ